MKKGKNGRETCGKNGYPAPCGAGYRCFINLRVVYRPEVWVTALKAFTWPFPYQELWPVPPWHSCGRPLLTPKIEEYPGGSVCGHGCGSAVCWISACTCPGRSLPFWGLFRSP